ncbi:MAG: MFS transporter [Propionibacteriaceae bacterium]|jgi:DHA3 family macrolide efflux protein-like MFS transporter|nr:MFS transporter [Propionibacteriaceae bacterium]
MTQPPTPPATTPKETAAQPCKQLDSGTPVLSLSTLEETNCTQPQQQTTSSNATAPATLDASDNARWHETVTGTQVGAHWKRDVALFYVGQAFSQFGSSVVAYAIIWWIALDSASSWKYGLAVIAQQVAMALMSIVGGAWADRYDRKLLMISSDAIIAVFTLLLSVALLTGHMDYWLIVVILVLRGLGGGVQSPASAAAGQQIVPKAYLLRINSINSALQSAVWLVAPAVAAVLISYVPLGMILWVDSTTAVIGIGLLLKVVIPRLPATAPHPDQPNGLLGYLHDTKLGLDELKRHPALLRASLIFAVLMVLLIAPSNLTPVFVVRFFGDESWKLAAAEVTWSFGTMFGALLMARWNGPKQRMPLLIGVAALWSVLMVALGFSPNIYVFAVLWLIFGLTFPTAQIMVMTSAQERIAPEKMGRVMGLFNVVLSLVMPAGMLVWGPLSDAISMRLVWAGCGLAALVFAGVMALQRGSDMQLTAFTETV